MTKHYSIKGHSFDFPFEFFKGNRYWSRKKDRYANQGVRLICKEKIK